MIITRPSVIKASPLELVLIVTAIIASTIIMSISPSNSNSNYAIAQSGSFKQPIKVNVDKSNYVLGDYGLIVKDLNTGNKVTNFYTDSEQSPRYIYIDGSIITYDGDSLTACIVDMSTKETACDTQTAFLSDDTTNFYIDMATAR